MAYIRERDRIAVFVMPRWYPPGIGGLFGSFFAVGFILMCGTIAMFMAIQFSWINNSIVANLGTMTVKVAAFLWPLLWLRRHYQTIQTTRRAVCVGVGFSMGLFCLPLSVPLFGSGTIIWPVFATWVVIIPLLFAIAWRVVRLTLPEFVEQDGTRCPLCAYCLLGTTEMRCPECDHAFTYAEIETTSLEFRERSQAPIN